MRRIFAAAVFALSCCAALAAQGAKTDAGPHGLNGPVRSVRVERTNRTTDASGGAVESPRHLVSVTAYDERGVAVERTTFDHRGAIQSRQVYGRDEQGNAVTALYGGDGKLLGRSVSQPENPDRSGGHLHTGANGESQRRSVYRRTPEGKIAEQEVYDASGALLQRSVYAYDAAGRQTEMAHYGPDGRLRDKSVWLAGGGFHSVRFNEDGSLFFEQKNESPAAEETDAHGNWTRHSARVINTQNGHTREYVEIIYRTIEYYPAKKQ